MKQISLAEATPGMVLARHIFNSSGQLLLTAGITLTEDYINKLSTLALQNLFVKDGLADIDDPEYFSMKTQQRALSILSQTISKIRKGETFLAEPIYAIASDIVEEILLHPSVLIQLTGVLVHDDYTLAHSLNCAIHASLLARISGLPAAKIKEVVCGALLHDVGKVYIDNNLLNKAGKLTSEEFSIMKLHTVYGFHALINKRWEFSSLVAHMAWQHHEKVDGSGYPRGLAGDEILGYARILAIVDVFEAVTADRPYRRGMLLLDAYNIIKAGLGTHFDTDLGQKFLAKIAIHPPGTEVLLSTGETAIVVSVPPEFPAQPTVRLIFHPDGTPYTPPRDIILTQNPQILIVNR